MVNANPRIYPKNNILWEFEIQIEQLILARIPDLVLINKTKKFTRAPNCENKRKRKFRQALGL